MKKIYILILLLCHFGIKLPAQECLAKKDTMYIIQLRYTYKNGNPMVNYFLVKNLDEIQSKSEIKTRQDFLCLMYERCIVFQEPFFTMGDYNNCYGFKTKSEKQSFFNLLAQKITKLNSKYLDIYSKNNEIVFSCVRVYAEFWILDKQRNVSGEIYSKICPHKMKNMI